MNYKNLSRIIDSKQLKKYDKGLIRRYLEERDFYEPLDLSNGMKFECILNDYGFKLYAVEVVPGETVWDDKEIRHLVWNTGDSLEDMDIDELAQACYDMIQSGNYLEED